MTTYLVTGAQGFIGRYLTDALLASSALARVVGVGRSERLDGCFAHRLSTSHAARAPLPEEMAERLRERVLYERADVVDVHRLGEIVRAHQPAVVFHLAAGLRYADREQLVRTNVAGTLAVIDAAAAADEIPRVVIGSSGSVYGALPAPQLPAREFATCSPVDLYGASKLAAEQMAALVARERGVCAMYARIFNVCGPGQDDHHVCGRLAAQLCAGAPVLRTGSLRATRDFADVRDVAAALARIGATGSCGETYNVASGEETSVAELLDRLIRAAAWTGDIASDDTARRGPDVPRHVADVARLRALGHVPRHSLDDTARDVVAYLASLSASC